MKTCIKCNIEKPRTEYHKNNMGRLGVATTCKQCHSVIMKVYNGTPKAKEVRQNRGLRTRYGISLDEYKNMLVSQGHRCAICNSDKPGGMGAFHVDHNHDTGKVRGLLCTNCNRRLGVVENKDFMNNANRYLGGSLSNV